MNVTRKFRRAAATAVLTLAVAPVTMTVAPPALSTAEAQYPLKRIGTLPEPAPGSVRTRAASIASIDAARRRMYYVYTDKDNFDHVVTYDLRPRIPKPMVDGRLVPNTKILAASPYAVALDSKRQQLAFITGNIDAADHEVSIGNPSITIYSDITHKVTKRWDMATIIPGFYPFGITYSAADDRMYLVGEFSGVSLAAQSTYTFGSKAAGAATAVVALNADTGALLWTRTVPECQQALFTLGVGGLLARATHRDALYFACVTGGTADGKTYPGQAGIVRMHIDPKAPTTAAAARLPIDFYAISGNYFNGADSGIAAFDTHTDRFFLQSLAPRTPGAWAFDGRLSSWVGIISAKTSADRFVGLNPRLGHLYMGVYGGTAQPKPTDEMVVADVRQTPVPAGESQPIITSSFIAADAGSNRVFVRPFDAPSTLKPYEIYEDLMPVTSYGNARLDYDADTTDTPDSPQNQTFHALIAAGYGAQSVQVGGSGGLGSVIGTPDLPGVAAGTRALMSARVGLMDLRPSSATASAQAALADVNTVQYYERNAAKEWPYRETTCNDSGDEKVTDSYRDDGPGAPANGGTSTVTCDRKNATVIARATMGASGSGTTTVQDSEYESKGVRTLKDGAVIDTVARTDGATFAVAGGFTVRFGRVVATASARAHGRPGTTAASWTRKVEGVRITDQTGTPLFTAPGCESSTTVGPQAGKREQKDTCGELAASINRVLPTRFRVNFPIPEATATPKGAFATVEQTDAEYFHQRFMNDQGVVYQSDSVGPRPIPAVVTEAYNDSTERSRTVTALAATQATAIFTVVPKFDYGTVDPPVVNPPDDPFTPQPGGTGTGAGTGTAAIPGTPGRPGEDTGADGVPLPVNASGDAVALGPELRGFLFMRRSARDAALLVLLAGLMLGGLGTVWRRRRLVDVLVTVTGKGTS